MSQELSALKPLIFWRKVLAIALIQGTITLTWVIYNLYLPDLLKSLGLAATLAQTLLIIEHLLEIIIEPLAGNFSDQQERSVATRLPIITFGILTSSLFFLLIPTLAIFGKEGVKGLFIIIVILWASAMALFRAPVTALLRKSAQDQYLTEATSLLTLFNSIIGSLQFDVFGVILKLGAPFAFFLGSLALLGSGFAMTKFFPPEIKDRQLNQNQTVKVKFSWFNIMIIIFTGIAIGMGLRFFFATLTQTFNNYYGEQGKLAMMLFSIMLGISAIFTGKIATKLGQGKGMLLGVTTTAIFLLILVFIPVKLINYSAIIILLIAFSFVLNGVLPFVLSLIPVAKTGVGMGLYFGFFGGAISFFLLLNNYLKTIFTTITPQINSMGGFICFAIASGLLYLSLEKREFRA